MNFQDLKNKDIIYYARVLPCVGVYEVCELKIRAIYDNWFSAVEKRTKRAYCFSEKDIDKTVFKDREKALEIVLKEESNNKSRTFSEKDTDIYE